MKKYYISKKDSSWQFKEEGAERAIKKSETKAEALKSMREFMKDKVGSVKIHKEDGKIQEERTYQKINDPRKTKG